MTINPLPNAISLWSANWLPMTYIHPEWLVRFNLRPNQAHDTRRWQLANALIVEQENLGNSKISNLAEIPSWWRHDSSLLAATAQEIGLRLIAGRMSSLLAGREIDDFANRLGGSLLSEVQLALQEQRLLRGNLLHIDWRTFASAPNPFALGLQVLLSQLPINAAAIYPRMRLRCSPELICNLWWQQNYHPKIFAAVSQIWRQLQEPKHEPSPKVESLC